MSLRAKIRGNRNFFPILPVSMWLLCALFSFSVIFLCCVFSVVFLSCISLLFYSLCYVLALSFVVDAVFFADLPILLPSVGLSLLLRIIIRIGAFRGSEAKKNRVLYCGWVVCIRKKGGRDIYVSHPPYVFGCVISCAGMMLCCCVG